MSDTLHQNFQACLIRIKSQWPMENAGAMGFDGDGGQIRIPFFNRRFRVSSEKIIDAQGRNPTDAVGLVLCRYLLNHPSAPVSAGKKVTFRELSGAGPLVARFAANTNKIIASAYGDDIERLTQRSRDLGGHPGPGLIGYDLTVRFDALPALPIWLQFNGADNLFPAQSTLLFNQSAERYLDMQSLFIVATYLTGQLVAA